MLSTLAAGVAGGLTGDSSANAVAGAQAGKNAVENNALSIDMYALDRKVKAAKERGDDITPLLDEYRELTDKDRAKMEAACKASPDTCGFSRDAANDAYNVILANGVYLGIDPDVANIVAQVTAKDNAVITQNTSAFGEGIVVAAEGAAIIAGTAIGTSIPFPAGRKFASGVQPNLNVNINQQNKHIVGTNEYKTASQVTQRSPLSPGVDAQKLVNKYAGTGQAANKVPLGQPGSVERITTNKVVGVFYDNGVAVGPTTNFTIRYGKDGVHIIPARP